MQTTTQLVDPKTKDWDRELIEKLGYPEEIFEKIKSPGYEVGELTEKIREKVGLIVKWFFRRHTTPPLRSLQFRHRRIMHFILVPEHGHLWEPN